MENVKEEGRKSVWRDISERKGGRWRKGEGENIKERIEWRDSVGRGSTLCKHRRKGRGSDVNLRGFSRVRG